MKNAAVIVAYFNNQCSHLEEQTDNGPCVRPAGNPTGIRADYLLNVSSDHYNCVTWALDVDIITTCID
jgi:hypothetical protein